MINFKKIQNYVLYFWSKNIYPEQLFQYDPDKEIIVPKGQKFYDPSVFGRYDLKSQKVLPIENCPSFLADLDIYLEKTQRMDRPPYKTERDRYSVLLKEISQGNGICLDACTNAPLPQVKNYVENNGYCYVPIDICPGEGIRQEDLTNLSFQNNSIDLIISSDTLEHIDNYNQAVKEIFRVLKPHSVAIIHVPCYYFEKFENEPISKNVDPWGHVWYFSARSLMNSFFETGFIIMRSQFIFDYGALLLVVQKPNSL